MIYIPYSSYYESCRVLDDTRLHQQSERILATLNKLARPVVSSPEGIVIGVINHLYAWNRTTLCDLAALGLYTCAELSRRGISAIDRKRMTAAWFRLRTPGKLRKRPQLDEALYQGFQQLLVWEEPEIYEEKFNMTYTPFKPEIQW